LQNIFSFIGLFCKRDLCFRESTNRSCLKLRYSSLIKYMVCVLRRCAWLKWMYKDAGCTQIYCKSSQHWDTVQSNTWCNWWAVPQFEVATISRLPKNIGLFCTRCIANLLQGSQIYCKGAQYWDTVRDSNEWRVYWNTGRDTNKRI